MKFCTVVVLKVLQYNSTVQYSTVYRHTYVHGDWYIFVNFYPTIVIVWRLFDSYSYSMDSIPFDSFDSSSKFFYSFILLLGYNSIHFIHSILFAVCCNRYRYHRYRHHIVFLFSLSCSLLSLLDIGIWYFYWYRIILYIICCHFLSFFLVVGWRLS